MKIIDRSKQKKKGRMYHELKKKKNSSKRGNKKIAMRGKAALGQDSPGQILDIVTTLSASKDAYGCTHQQKGMVHRSKEYRSAASSGSFGSGIFLL